ncbi:MAG: hypothetical protein H7287_04755 [Thermoleophilia bacterium]|nr:hypothetical protein [Thermoleophilia bacterium]
MPASLRNSIARRRYRLAQSIIVAGSLALGLLVLTRLVDLFRTDFFLYYGVSDSQFHLLQSTAAARVPFTVGQFAVAVLALAVVSAFVRNEHRRVRQVGELDDHCRRSCSEVVVERPAFTAMFDQFVARTAALAGLLFCVWLLQTSFERWLGGFGLGLEYVDWRSLLPLASVFGLCVLVGMLVAAISMVGLRAIHVLEVVLAGIMHRSRPRLSVPKLPHTIALRRTFRELRGCDILSRPPPAFA